MKNWFRHHLENFISFPLIYRFAGIRFVLTELEADNWRHCSNYTVTLSGLNVATRAAKPYWLISHDQLQSGFVPQLAEQRWSIPEVVGSSPTYNFQ